jgi:hypothetical protein
VTVNTKLALAMAVPAIALFAGAMTIRGPGARLEGARRRRARFADGEDLSTLTPSEINRRLDRLDKLSSKLTDEFIAAGRGHELPSETFKKTDPLAERKRRVWADSDALHREISRRYGPGAPSRLPTRRTR